ncbi:MAG TPA: TerB N-terminal domain-containing protein [Caulobacteraceae bacterium]|nr:TerB N-terminal domain-containing protein [Caulobacteraceae bacterium]
MRLLCNLIIVLLLLAPALAGAKAHVHAAGTSAQFRLGAADRQAWEAWYAGTSGPFHDGATYWVQARSEPHHSGCGAAAPLDDGDEWTKGCNEAKQRLQEPDHRRAHSREYRRGWNSVSLADVAASPSPVTAPDTSSDGWPWLFVLTLVGIIIAVVVSRRAHNRTAATPTSSVPATAPKRTYVEAPRVSRPTYSRTSYADPWHLLTVEEARAEGNQAWLRRKAAVTIAGIPISGGMIYVGRTLHAFDRSGAPDNCLVDPSLDVASSRASTDLPYWPSYSRISAQARRNYLEWLASDRSDPETPLGYVFLYFYGLERRLMLDRSAADRQNILDEVTRLRAIYGGNHSFQSYSARLIAAAQASELASSQLEPVFVRDGFGAPFRVRVGLGRFAARGEPIPPDWVLSWLITDGQYYLRTSATRDTETFRETFCKRWSDANPRGVTFTPQQVSKFPKVALDYRAASSTFTVQETVPDAPPDITGARRILDRAHAVALACCEELDEYSRMIGRDSAWKGTLMADAHLPKFTDGWRDASASAGKLAARASPPTLQAVAQLADGDARDQITPTRHRRVVNTFRALGFGLAPDPELTIGTVSPALPVHLYPLPAGEDATPDAMKSTALIIQIGAMIAAADGIIAPEERAQLLAVANTGAFDSRQQARLTGQAEWLLATPPASVNMKSRLAKASDQERRAVVKVAIAMALADGRLAAQEVKHLEKLFGWLGLPQKDLYSALHGGGPVQISEAVESPQGQAVPRRPASTKLDPARIAAITRETAEAAAMLQGVFGADDVETPSAALPEPAREPDHEAAGVFHGLPGRLGEFAEAVAARDSWPRSDLAALAAAHDTMLDGAIERINDWAIDHLGDLLIEEGDPYTVNRALLAHPLEVQ